jgi:hypothetical protein
MGWNRYAQLSSLAVCVNPGSAFNCYWVMPFRKSCRITITNEAAVDYDDNIIFGLYMDSGVGGSALSCDGIAESDDDNAFWDRSRSQVSGGRLNLVYTWDKNGNNRFGETTHQGYDLDGVDLYADVNVGRLACIDVTEVNPQVKSLIKEFKKLLFSSRVFHGCQSKRE